MRSISLPQHDAAILNFPPLDPLHIISSPFLILLAFLPTQATAFLLPPSRPSSLPFSRHPSPSSSSSPSPFFLPPSSSLLATPPVVLTEEEAERSSDLLAELDELAGRGRYQEALALLKSGGGTVGAVHYHKVRKGGREGGKEKPEREIERCVNPFTSTSFFIPSLPLSLPPSLFLGDRSL